MTCNTSQRPAIQRFEAALLDAVAAFGDRLQRSADPVRRSAESLLARLGFDLPAPGAPLPAPALEALRRENERLRRAAARGDARYDLNRHIAVNRLLRTESAAPPQTAGEAPRLSGSALNNRFRRARPA